MSIQSEITRLQAAKADIVTALENKGVTVPSNATLDDLADLVEAFEGGGGGLNWRGEYVSGTKYEVNDAVYYQGSSYICKVANAIAAPTMDYFWDVLAQGGGGSGVEVTDDGNGNLTITNATASYVDGNLTIGG